MHKCKNLKCKKLTNNRSFCSNLCQWSVCSKENGFETSKKCRKNNTGAFFNQEIRLKNAIVGKLTMKKNKTGVFGLSKEQRIINGRISGKIGGSKTVSKYGGWAWITDDKRRKNLFNVIHTLRINIRNLKFKGQYYDSKPEIEISLCLQEQYNYKPEENKTLHVIIGRFEHDYVLENLKLIIEYHPWDLNQTLKQYYKRRRKNLDVNEYEGYELIVI